jgi:hypothetical protein
MLTNAMATGTPWAMSALATALQVAKWAMARVTRAIITYALSSPLLSPQPSSLLVPTPQLPNTVALCAAIAAVVSITQLFDTTIKQQ